jgi:hypothetical protein
VNSNRTFYSFTRDKTRRLPRRADPNNKALLTAAPEARRPHKTAVKTLTVNGFQSKILYLPFMKSQNKVVSRQVKSQKGNFSTLTLKIPDSVPHLTKMSP